MAARPPPAETPAETPAEAPTEAPTEPNSEPHGEPLPEQLLLNFNPVSLTPEESERLRCALRWEVEQEALEEFQPLPGETMSEFLAAREAYQQALETFGPNFPRQPCQAWQMVQGVGQGKARPLAVKRPQQLTLPF
jgi:hypothetical protein